MSDCRFGLSPVNYPDLDPEQVLDIILSRQRTTKALTAQMRRLICDFVVRIWHKTGFLMTWLISFTLVSLNK